MVGYGLFVGLFGTFTDWPQWLRNLSPMEHTGQPPLDGISWPATMILPVIAGRAGGDRAGSFRRRDLETK